MAKSNAHSRAFEEKHLKPGEQIQATCEGYIGDLMGKGKNAQHNGSLVVTRERVVFYRKGFFGEIIESIPLKSITSIERRSMLGIRTVALHTSHDALTFKTVSEIDEHLVLQAIEEGRASGASASGNVPTTAPAAASTPVQVLKQLGELRDAGLLTQQEFEAKKAELLQRI